MQEIGEIERELEDNAKLIELYKKKVQQEQELKELLPKPEKKENYLQGMKLNFKGDTMPKNDLLKLDSKAILKLSASDVCRIHNRIKQLTIINVAGLVITLLTYVFNPLVGSGVAVLICTVNGFYMVISSKEMQRLKLEYGL